jgi:predicted nucleic acid-binding protein
MREIIGKQPCITFVTLGELTPWAELRQWGRRNRDALGHWLDGVIVLPYTDDVARTWGQISAYAIRRGRPRPANDSWIAACASPSASRWRPSTPRTSKTSPNTRA